MQSTHAETRQFWDSFILLTHALFIKAGPVDEFTSYPDVHSVTMVTALGSWWGSLGSNCFQLPQRCSVAEMKVLRFEGLSGCKALYVGHLKKKHGKRGTSRVTHLGMNIPNTAPTLRWYQEKNVQRQHPRTLEGERMAKLCLLANGFLHWDWRIWWFIGCVHSSGPVL